MLSGEQIKTIVDYFVEPSVHIHLAKLEDIKRHPNDILTSYFMAELSLGRSGLVEVLEDVGSLDGWLAISEEPTLNAAESQDSDVLPSGEEGLPELPEGYHYGMPLELIAKAISLHSNGYVAFGSGIKGNGKLLAAKTDVYAHEFPSDKRVPYVNLTDELPANVSILEAGYSATDGEGAFKIYVRQNSIVTLAAMFEALKDTPEFNEFRGMSPNNVEYHSAGIVVAHELGEIELAKNGNVPNTPMEEDMAAEAYSRQFLEENGFPMEFYKLFHTLRAAPDNGSKNVSSEILKIL